ncbi:GIY-YIG nuclease family protein [Flavivirga sp. 57AJ16]|uniref:GIY-YIG nuclease family protein n=1 Tax=Flavivirga sp. 57AJ16 TaxID=3025307 RepID=UPI002366E78E|nr:GIY-YIG nuclease family protein [Flavivirga sp. 57AJ16]MDD7886672.1 GIY-YIG nuclease family protein [Flavivirga sp. 57AJ16]
MKTDDVYILKCSEGLIYTGVTNNLSRRFEKYQNGLNKNGFTFKRRPLKLVFHQEFNDINQAISFEKKIKNWRAKEKLALANKNFNMLQILAACRKASHSKYNLESEPVSTALDQTNQ